MVPAMIAVFVVALSIPEAWHDEPGGLNAPAVLAVAYIVIRLVHEGLYVIAAAGDPGLRHQLALNLVPLTAGGILLLIGVGVNDTAPHVGLGRGPRGRLVPHLRDLSGAAGGGSTASPTGSNVTASS